MKGFLSIISREWEHVYGSKGGMLLLLVVPFVVYFILNSLYGTGSIKELPIAVYDQDNSKLSRTVERFLDASPLLKVTQQLSSEDEMEDVLRYGKVQAIVYFPPQMERHVFKSKSDKVVIYTNSSNIVFGNLIYRAASQVVVTTSAGILISKLTKGGMTKAQALDMFQPIRMSFRPLYNSTYNYLFYLAPGLMTVLLQMIVMFAAARAFNREFNGHGVFRMIELANGSVFKMLFAKYIAYLLFASVLVLMIFGIFYPWFGLPLKADYSHIFLLMFLLVSASIWVGFVFSVILKDEMMSMDVTLFYNSPAFVFSGFTFPLMGMPWYSQFYAGIIPYTHFLYGFLKVDMMAAPLHFAYPEIMALIVFIVLGMLISFSVLSIRLNKLKKEVVI